LPQEVMLFILLLVLSRHLSGMIYDID